MRWREAFLAALLAQSTSAPAFAQDARASASVEQGRSLLAEHKCNGSCHQSYSEDNDPLTLYTRADRKIRNRDELDAQVRRCVASLGSMIFPDDLENISQALDADYYRFEPLNQGAAR